MWVGVKCKTEVVHLPVKLTKQGVNCRLVHLPAPDDLGLNE